ESPPLWHCQFRVRISAWPEDTFPQFLKLTHRSSFPLKGPIADPYSSSQAMLVIPIPSYRTSRTHWNGVRRDPYRIVSAAFKDRIMHQRLCRNCPAPIQVHAISRSSHRPVVVLFRRKFCQVPQACERFVSNAVAIG